MEGRISLFGYDYQSCFNQNQSETNYFKLIKCYVDPSLLLVDGETYFETYKKFSNSLLDLTDDNYRDVPEESICYFDYDRGTRRCFITHENQMAYLHQLMKIPFLLAHAYVSHIPQKKPPTETSWLRDNIAKVLAHPAMSYNLACHIGSCDGFFNLEWITQLKQYHAAFGTEKARALFNKWYAPNVSPNQRREMMAAYKTENTQPIKQLADWELKYHVDRNFYNINDIANEAVRRACLDSDKEWIVANVIGACFDLGKKEEIRQLYENTKNRRFESTEQTFDSDNSSETSDDVRRHKKSRV